MIIYGDRNKMKIYGDRNKMKGGDFNALRKKEKTEKDKKT